MDSPDPVDQQVAMLKSDLIPIMEAHPRPWTVVPHAGSHSIVAADGHHIAVGYSRMLADALMAFVNKFDQELAVFYDFDPESL